MAISRCIKCEKDVITVVPVDKFVCGACLRATLKTKKHKKNGSSEKNDSHNSSEKKVGDPGGE